MRGRVRLLPLLLVLALPTGSSAADLRLAAPFGDGMVLQRLVPVPVRGWAAAGVEVRVTLAGWTRTTRADEAGRWQLLLPPRPAGGPFEMEIEAAGERLRLRQLRVGDVWLCSGQSNMEWVLRDSLDAAGEIAAARDPLLRHYKVPRSWSAAPESTLDGGLWEAADGEQVGGFTAVGYFFARRLRSHLGVPIGLINTTWGGSRIEAWMSAASLGLDEAGVRELMALEREQERRTLADLEERAGGLPQRDGGLVDGRAVWADPQLDDSGWHEIAVPSAWEAAGWEGMDGIGWYRASFELSAAEAADGIRLGLGTIDDSDLSWVNGHPVGGMENAWNRPRLYEVAAEALVAGRNVLAVRVEDTGGGGGIQGGPDLLFVESAGHRRPLAGTWRFQLGAVTLNLEDRKRNVPTMLYNAMLHPLQGFPVKGILWYQGESNTGPDDAFVYRRLFQAMIEDWRRGWQATGLPFLWAQLASFLPPPEEPGESGWALLRESQSAALVLPGTAQAVLIDAGDADDVHPRDKRVVGERLALAARAVAYGEEIVFSGPVVRGQVVRDGRMVIEFDHVGGGLVAGQEAGGELTGFAIAGTDRRFVWARAEIAGDRVEVWSPRVPAPVAVRYGWADNPSGANLYNREGLPASPFRTDDWPVAAAAEPLR